MNDRMFVVEKNGPRDFVSGCEKLTLRNRYIKWNIAREGIPADLPDGTWIVTLERHPNRRVILPGLVFREA